MDPRREYLEINVALILARDRINNQALKTATEAQARAAAKELAKGQGIISTDLSAADFKALCE